MSKNKMKNMFKILFCFNKSVNVKEMFVTWIRILNRIHFFPVQIQDPDLDQN